MCDPFHPSLNTAIERPDTLHQLLLQSHPALPQSSGHRLGLSLRCCPATDARLFAPACLRRHPCLPAVSLWRPGRSPWGDAPLADRAALTLTLDPDPRP